MTNIGKRKKLDTQKAYRTFFEALSAGSLPFLIETAAEFFGMPVLLTDRHYRLICLSPDRDIGETVYDTLRRENVLPEGTVEAFQNMYLQEEGATYEPFYSDTGLVAECPRIFGEIYDNEQILGHFAIMMFDKPLFDNDLACAAILRDALKIIMTARPSQSYADIGKYLTDLASLRAPDSLRLFASEIIGRKIPGRYAVMVTQTGNTASRRAFAAMRASEIPDRFYSAVSTVCGGMLITLFGSVGKENYTEKEKKFFRRSAKMLRQAGNSGLSIPFDNLLTLPDRIQEAYLASQCGQELSLFSEVMPAPLFLSLCSERDSSIFLHPALEKIREYDQANDTDYFETLRIYSFCMHDKKTAANELHIHRNTLLYRLNRMVELFEIAIEDPRTARIILNSFQLLKVKEDGGLPFSCVRCVNFTEM